MPPRYAYWTILVDDQPTAFRASAQEDLLPTFKRLKQKHPTAVMKWFQNGKLWDSRVDAQEAMHARGERGRSADPRQSGFRSRDRSSGPRDFKTSRPRDFKAPRPHESKPPGPGEKLEWKPKGEFTPAPRRSESPDWKPKASFDRNREPEWRPRSEAEGRKPQAASPKPQWKPKGSFDRDRKPAWKPKGSFDRKPEWKPKGSFQKSDAEGGGPRRSPQREGGREGRPEWKPKGSFDRDRKPEWKPRSGAEGGRSQAARSKPSKREGAWIPNAEYKKSKGIDAKRDKNWRPGGEHKDPRQKYKDAKKAKWSRFKTTIRSRWETKQGKKKS